MRINDENQKLEMEERDWNYIMPAYLRSYLFYTKNVPPAEVVFPMFKTVKYGDMVIPVRWVEPDSKEATEVAADAKNIPEATEAEIAQKDAEEKPPIAEQVKKITEEVLTPTPEDLICQQQEAKPEEVSAARAAFAEEAARAVDKAEKERYEQEDERVQGMVDKIKESVGVPTAAEIQAEVEADAARDAAIDKAEAEAKAKAAQEATGVTAATEVSTTPPAPDAVISEATQPATQPPQPTPEPTEPGTNAKPPATDRKPKLPPVVIPPGQPLDGMHPRDKADQSRIAKDLAVQREVDEGKEIEQDVSELKE